MFILYVLLLSIAIGYLRGGRLNRLAQVNLQKPWLLVVALAFKFLTWLPSQYAIPRHLLVYGLLFLFLWLNRQIWGFKIVGLGLFSNFLAIISNGGFMPIAGRSLLKAGFADFYHLLKAGRPAYNSILITSQTKLAFLGDIFYLPLPPPFHNVFSLGDIAVALGVFVFIQKAMIHDSQV